MARTENENVFKCRNTIIEMLMDRGYTPNNTTEHYEYDEFERIHPNVASDRSSIRINVMHPIQNNQLTVHFFDEEKVGLKILKNTVEFLEKTAANIVIFITKDNLSSAGFKYIEEIPNVEIFKEKELLFNITKHELVPKHKILNNKEKMAFLKQRKILENQLPQILTHDPIARYHGAKKGDVVYIERKSETAGISIYYRITVPGMIKK